MSSGKSKELVDHLFRHEYGRMVAILTGSFGFSNIELIEDAVQESFYKALSSWRIDGPPRNPSGWLLQVSRNKAIDLLRREQKKRDVYIKNQDSNEDFVENGRVFLGSEIRDDELRLIFTCCHPDLTLKDQIALTLKTVSGFSIKEIAKALLSKEGTIKKRIHRARQQIIRNNIRFKIPLGNEINARLDAVYAVLYLMFNEGYSSSKDDELIRKELCVEAMRLLKLIIDRNSSGTANGKALLALMCYHAARFESRLNSINEMVLLADQDRTIWNRSLIEIGNKYMNQAMVHDRYSIYHVEAAIAAEHCMANTFGETNWDNLLTLYNLLCDAKDSDICQVNKAVVLIQMQRFEEAYSIIQSLEPETFGRQSYLYHCVAADLYRHIGDESLLIHHLQIALNTAFNQSEKKLIEKKLVLAKSQAKHPH